MIKDLILAILLGAVLGFGVTGGYYAFKNSSTKNGPLIVVPTTIPTPIDQTQDSPKAVAPTATPAPASTTSLNQNLSISYPENETLVNTSTISIKGMTTANSLVVIQTPQKSYSLQTDSTGAFTQANVELEAGVNLIQISAFDPNDVQSDTEILVTYSSAKI